MAKFSGGVKRLDKYPKRHFSQPPPAPAFFGLWFSWNREIRLWSRDDDNDDPPPTPLLATTITTHPRERNELDHPNDNRLVSHRIPKNKMVTRHCRRRKIQMLVDAVVVEVELRLVALQCSLQWWCWCCSLLLQFGFFVVVVVFVEMLGW